MPKPVKLYATTGRDLLGRVTCPTCKGEVKIWGMPGEPLDDSKPIRCPEDNTVLNGEARRQLGWKG